MNPDTMNGQLFMVTSTHYDMKRFIMKWLHEGRGITYTEHGLPKRFRARRYSTAIAKAAQNSQLVIVTGPSCQMLDMTTECSETKDSLVAVIIFGGDGLPVRPLVLASEYWENIIDWNCIITLAHKFRCTFMHHDLGINDTYTNLSPQLIVVEPNIFGEYTSSATPQKTTTNVIDDTYWSFSDTLATIDQFAMKQSHPISG
jgi:hypothetical protein